MSVADVTLFGREDVLAALDEWADSDSRAPTLVLLGGPGVGKSAIVQKWLSRRLERIESGSDTEALIHHVVQPGQEDTAIVHSLLEQCDRLVPRNSAPDESAESSQLRVALERAAEGRRRLLIVLDALDEGSNLGRLRALLRNPPAGVRFLCSSRPRAEENAGLGGPPAVSCIDLDREKWRASNEATCRTFWSHRQTEAAWLTSTRIDEALRAGLGNMLYAVQLWRLLNSVSADEREELMTPPTLDAVLERTWQRINDLTADVGRPIIDALGILALARESLLLSQVSELAGWPSDEDRKIRTTFLTHVRPILQGDESEGFRLYHTALSDAIRRYHPDLTGLGRAILPRLVGWLTSEHPRSRSYAARHVVNHCRQVDSWAQLIEACVHRATIITWIAMRADVAAAVNDLEEVAHMMVPGEQRRGLRAIAKTVRDSPADWRSAVEQLWSDQVNERPPPPHRPQRDFVLATASPADRVPLDTLNEEDRIRSALASAPGLRVIPCRKTRFSDLRAAMYFEPAFLHIGCHGSENGPFAFEYEPDSDFLPNTTNVVRLLRALGSALELVVFNACCSNELAEELAERRKLVPLAIGMRGYILDNSAIEFAENFYRNLVARYTVLDAFHEARDRIKNPLDRDRPALFASTEEAKQKRLLPRPAPGA